MRLSCLLGAHRRTSSVWWDGFDFCSKCKHCGTPLYKRGNKRWRRLDRKREAMFLRYQAAQVEFLPDSREPHTPKASRGSN
jgi:hypothetical protein